MALQARIDVTTLIGKQRTKQQTESAKRKHELDELCRRSATHRVGRPASAKEYMYTEICGGAKERAVFYKIDDIQCH